MRTIVYPSKRLCSVIGIQKRQNIQYRLMKYLLHVEVEHGMLLHNVINGHMVFLPFCEWSVEKGFPRCDEADMDELIHGYFLVPADFNEYEFVRGLRLVFQLISRNERKPITKYTILPTTNCNAHCFYCYESQYTKTTMSDKTAEDVVDFIDKHSGGEPVEISWFGGEPTVGERQIDYICSMLKLRGIKYNSSMISNGFLFTPKLVDKAVKKWNLGVIQITLDGTEEVYNKTKSFNIHGSAYKRVLNNIRLLLDAGVHVSVLMNLDFYNVSDLYALADELSRLFPERKNLAVASHVLFNNEGYETVYHTESDAQELAIMNHELVEYMIGIGLNANVLGGSKRSHVLPTIRYLYCKVHDNKSVVIDPNGNFHRCEHIDNDLNSAFGLYTGWFSKEEMDKWFTSIEYARCRECILYPNCLIPKYCENFAGCFPVDVEARVEQYRETARSIYYHYIENNREVQ